MLPQEHPRNRSADPNIRSYVDHAREYLARSRVHRDAERLELEFMRHNRSPETRATARTVLAAIQGVYRSLFERGERVTPVESVYITYDTSLRYHLGDQGHLMALTSPLDVEHKEEVLSSSEAFEIRRISSRTIRGARPSRRLQATVKLEIRRMRHNERPVRLRYSADIILVLDSLISKDFGTSTKILQVIALLCEP
jgi:hypothetical protein